jgi:phosphoglycolate phosphatase
MTWVAIQCEGSFRMMMPRPRAVLFDLDGTLVDTLDDITLALGRALEKHGRRALARDAVSALVGDGARVLVARALSAPADGPLVESVLGSFLEAYAADPTPRTRLMPGALELLDALAARSIAAVVVTNKPGALARAIVESTLGGRVVATLGGGDTVRLKPDPEPIHAALARVSVDAALSWMVGDGLQDIAAARAASVFSIGVSGGYGKPEGADLSIDALDELIAFV